MKTIKLKSNIINDDYTNYIYDAFDIQNKEESIVEIPINFEEINNFDWQIGVIYGGSGTGKSTLLKQFGLIEDISFDNSKSLISNFTMLKPEEATFLLSSIGLSSVPTWLRPYHLLSNGEQYRAQLAYKISIAKDNEIILIDEFTSVVDRDVAKAMSFALQKFIRKTNKKIILASCHFDIMDWLLPDWTYSPLNGRVEKHDYLRRERPQIELSIFRCRYETWNIFKQHHYLSSDLSKSAKCFVTLYNDKPICFNAVLPLPSGTLKNAFRMSRTVVLPDFQGMGLGGFISDYIASLYVRDGKRFYAKTSNPALWNKRENSKKWRVCDIQDNLEKIRLENEKGGQQRKVSITKSFEFVGDVSHIKDEELNLIQFNADAWKYVAQNQISLF